MRPEHTLANSSLSVHVLYVLVTVSVHGPVASTHPNIFIYSRKHLANSVLSSNMNEQESIILPEISHLAQSSDVHLTRNFISLPAISSRFVYGISTSGFEDSSHLMIGYWVICEFITQKIKLF